MKQNATTCDFESMDKSLANIDECLSRIECIMNGIFKK